ncbi:MAG: alkaline phosphatase D family protein [Ramlibacter sp.]|nr:alkaline phosphatase D family protein [Ramlibacter sp.]
MRIAFTSCFSAQLFKKQPVWNEIAAANPDVLILLGDSVYYDVGDSVNSSGVQAMTDMEFAAHAYKKFGMQVAHPRFKALIQTPTLSTYAIWDDHDFLWDNACGANVMRAPQLRPLVYPSRAMFAAYRNALAQHLAPGSFPSAPPNWSADTPAPEYAMVDLGSDVFLHLTDGRTWRDRSLAGVAAMLGSAQLSATEANMAAASAGAVHLIASGSVVEARHGECWMQCEAEYNWLLSMAKKYNILVLSGDIHDNNLNTIQVTPARRLYEATSSGAALKTGVVIGSLQRNYGMLTIDASNVDIEICRSGAPQYRGTVSRSTWL